MAINPAAAKAAALVGTPVVAALLLSAAGELGVDGTPVGADDGDGLCGLS
jgi:hypothetical protein